jgi:vanillate monooxygenase ferredoxin subunit
MRRARLSGTRPGSDTRRMNQNLLLDVVVSAVSRETDEVSCFELSRTDGPLPPFEAGAHIDVHTAVGPRQYSLCNLHEANGPYVVGVKREAGGRGGSRWVHDTLKVGARLVIGAPRNNFRLVSEAVHHCLLAGGIGITPLVAMAHELGRRGHSFNLVCFARSRAHAAFRGRLQAAPWAAQVRFHFDDTPSHQVDLSAFCAHQPEGTHFYVCGPAGFMAATRQATSQCPGAQLHEERFAAEPAANPTGLDRYTVALARSRRSVRVEAGQTLLQALRGAGLNPLTSCEAGVCGSCVTPYLEGQPVHGDAFLSAHERQHQLALCCAGSLGERLVLDL